MDLYSGDPVRVADALRCLIDTPQNNLRVFACGNIVFPESVQHTAATVSHSALVASMAAFVPGKRLLPLSEAQLLECFVCCTKAAILHSRVLDAVLAVQRRDAVGITRVAAAFERARLLACERTAACSRSDVLRALQDDAEVRACPSPLLPASYVRLPAGVSVRA